MAVERKDNRLHKRQAQWASALAERTLTETRRFADQSQEVLYFLIGN